MKKICFYCLIALLITSCAEKTVKYVVIGETVQPKKLPSTITINEFYSIADTTVVGISGKIHGSYIHEMDTIQEILELAQLKFTDIKTQTVFEKFTNSNGAYAITLPAATYEIEVNYVLFTPILVKNVRLGTGELFEFNVNLGQGFNKEVFKALNRKDRRIIVRTTAN